MHACKAGHACMQGRTDPAADFIMAAAENPLISRGVSIASYYN